MARYKYGFCEWYLPEIGPLSLQLCAEMGYGGIQIADHGGIATGYPLTDRRIAQAYVEASKQYGIEIQCLNLISVNVDGCMKAPAGSPLHDTLRKTLEKGLRACEMIGIPNMFIPSARLSRILNCYDLENTMENLRMALSLAQNTGVQLLYESFSPIEETIKMCEYAGNGLKLMYDTLNPIRYGFGKDAVTELEAYGVDLIHTVHCKDSVPTLLYDELLGQGVGKFQEAAAKLNEMGYSGWVINENNYFTGKLSASDTDPWTLAKQDLAFMREVFQG